MSGERPNLRAVEEPQTPAGGGVTRRGFFGVIGTIAAAGVTAGGVIALDRKLPGIIHSLRDSRQITPEVRAMMVNRMGDLQNALDVAINPSLVRFDLRPRAAESDQDLAKWFNKVAVRQSPDRIEWKLDITTGVSEQKSAPVFVTTEYDFDRRMRQALVEGNIIEISKVLDKLSPFVDAEGNKLHPDRLQEVAETFFAIPEGTKWFPMFENPSRDSTHISVIGRFGGVEYINQADRQASVDVTGRASMMLTVPIFNRLYSFGQ